MTPWGTARLGEKVEILNRKRIPLSRIERAKRQGPYRYFGAQGVIDHIDGFLFDGEYLLVAEDGENLRSRKQPVASLVSGQFWVNNHAHILRAREGVANNRFLLHAINSAALGGLITGAAQPKLTKANLERLELPCPSPRTQDRIAAFLAAFDELIEMNERRIELLEELARSLYREWFVRFRFPGRELVDLVDSAIGPVPADWSISSLGEAAASLVDGDWVETKDQGGDAYRLLQVSNIGLATFRETGNRRYVSSETFDRLRCTSIGVGDILISRMPDPIGRAWLVDYLPEPAITAVDVAILRPISPASGIYLSLWLNSPSTIGHAEAVATGTTRKRVSRSVLSSFRLCIPPARVLARFDQIVRPILDERSILAHHNDRLAATRDLLLPRLVTGRHDISDIDLGDLLPVEAT
jgi:type I restriction enzyme S subunit